MKQLFIFFFVLGLAYALKEKKINLHDIERDNLANEKQIKYERTTQQPKYSQPYVQPPSIVQSPTHYGFLQSNPVKTAQHYVQSPQQYTVPFQQYYIQPQVNPYRTQQYAQYQQYENVPYVTDNTIAHQQQQQQRQYYATPQYVYVQQPYPAASTSVQSVVSPKGGIQYVMYIPTPTYVQPTLKGEQTQTYENVVTPQTYAVPQATYTTDTQPQVYASPQSPTQEIQYTTQYITQPQPQSPQKYVQYVQPQAKYVTTTKREPQSLLESYVPSALQLQYFKQQQNEINAIRQSAKVSPPVTGKTEYVKSSYRVPQSQAAETAYTYTYQLPAEYVQQSIKDN